MFSLNFMFFCSLIEELCTKEENYKTSCNFNFGHECTSENTVNCKLIKLEVTFTFAIQNRQVFIVFH